MYHVKEIFYSPQGEGHRSGTMNVFVRFTGCNLQCVDAKKLDRPLHGNEIDAGFHCDTDFHSGDKMTRPELVAAILKARGAWGCRSIIFTGGEPTLQLDEDLILSLMREGFSTFAIETNGTKPIPEGVNWVSCSPKPGSKIAIHHADEVRCVVRPGQVPDPMGIVARHFFVSPACDAPTADKIPGWISGQADFSREAMKWTVEWCRENPTWRISLQIHKILQVR